MITTLGEVSKAWKVSGGIYSHRKGQPLYYQTKRRDIKCWSYCNYVVLADSLKMRSWMNKLEVLAISCALDVLFCSLEQRRARRDMESENQN